MLNAGRILWMQQKSNKQEHFAIQARAGERQRKQNERKEAKKREKRNYIRNYKH